MQRTPQHIVAYRGLLDPTGCSLTGQVLARPIPSGPGENDSWWDNLRNTYRRFDSERVPGVRVVASFRGHRAEGISDEDGYYSLQLPILEEAGTALWDTAQVTQDDQEPIFIQPVLCVSRTATFGVISDIDDTVLYDLLEDFSIWDLDPTADSLRDRIVHTQITSIAGTGVPMLRVSNSNAIAAHARQLGLIGSSEILEVAREVVRDQARPELKDVAQP